MRHMFLAAICLGVSGGLATAQTCSLEEFDRENPASEVDQTPSTNKTHFEWGSDVDSWGRNNDGVRFWHYVKNLHDMKLSVDWIKTGLVIPVDEPTEKGYVVCAYDYGSENDFSLDRDAPIITSNDGDKDAVAYVVNGGTAANEDPTISGAEIRSDYTSESGEKASGIVRLILYYFPSYEILEVEIFAGPKGEKLAFSPSAMGLEAEQVAVQLSDRGIDNIELGNIEKFVKFDDFTFRALSENMGEVFVRVSTDEEILLKFEDIEDIPARDTNILLFSSGNSLIAIKKLSMYALSSAK